MAYGDVANLQITSWKPSFNSEWLGWVDRVAMNLELIKKPIKVGSMGDIVLGELIIGLTGTVRIEFRETDLVLAQKLTPWWTSGSIALSPPTPVDLYTYAKALKLHPQNLADNVLDKDVNFLKGVPSQPFKIDRDGNTWDFRAIDFSFYPDRSQFPNIVYGWIGNAPT